jgi:3-methyladenine DNA glycosylase AlkD
MKVTEYLFSVQDLKYRDFNSKLIPNIEKDTVIGVRTPLLRNYAKQMIKNGDVSPLLKELPHKYFEENQIHAFIISELKDYGTVIAELERFLPYIDNWATCDQLSPKVFKKNTDKLIDKATEWINSDRTYTIRFGIGIFMQYFLDDKFSEEYLSLIASIRSDEYYVNMMIAWYFATALAKQYSSTVVHIEEKHLDKWVHNKAIQKACESYRVTDEHKAYLKSLKIKRELEA